MTYYITEKVVGYRVSIVEADNENEARENWLHGKIDSVKSFDEQEAEIVDCMTEEEYFF